MDFTLNTASPRAYKAKYAKRLSSKSRKYLFFVIYVASFTVGIGLFLIKNNLAGLALSPALILFVIDLWNKGELSNLDENVKGSSISDKLDSSILAGLKTNNPSARELWDASKDTSDRWFFQNRYMIHHVLFEQGLNNQPGSAQQVWQIAEELRAKYNQQGYTAAIIIVALLKSIPDVEEILHKVKLELSEIEQGIQWVSDIDAKRKLAKESQHFGGWARDWAYGYTPVLRYVGHNVTEEVQMHGFFADTAPHDLLVNQMFHAMGTGSGSITLVGEIGVGKTTCVRAFAKGLIANKDVPNTLKHKQVISLDAPSLLSQTKNINELENLMIRIFNEASRAKNIILFFDDAHVFFGEGKESVDLSNILQQALDAGGIKMIFALTPRQWQNVGSKNPAVAAKLEPLQVQPAGEKETLHVLRDKVLMIEYKRKVLYTQQALKEAYRLGGRYVETQSMPGAALAVLEAAAPVATDGYVTAEVVQQSIESSFGVKIQQSKGDESKSLLSLEDDLHKYVINQKQAVSVIANALRRSRSGVGNPERPVGTFLFLGPTGVGKTELSKALARVYFGDESSMIRVDMNQFVNTEDVTRLITPMLGEQLGFLGQVRRRPFSVILLDEIEKAHKSVINLLLQMLDEGVMSDVDNKPVSFKDAIIIATSNAGADLIRQKIDEGEDVSKIQATLVDAIIERQIFAPEFINRYDEVVVFRPLTEEELLQVIDLILAGINKTVERQKVKVELTSDAKKWLVHKGYDAKLGARPMRRVVQKYVENILAKKILGQEAGGGSQIKLDVSDFESIEDV